MSTHYEVLGVASTADHAEIRRAYYRAARRWHPDGFIGVPDAESERAELQMRRVNEAWEVLGEAESRRDYDRRIGGSGAAVAGSGGIRNDDGVIRIDPRLLDPEFVAARRHAQFDEISNRSSAVLRVAPILALLGLLAVIFVYTAYARGGGESATTTTFPGPSLGTGIEAGTCVSVIGGPSLLARPCDANADGLMIGAREPDGVCPLGTVRDVELANGAIACLAAIR
ncbi:MAG: J domain-containing protein [Acidimicrobiia bacterium]|nr:J domain-containing protein [Acidimicrobiia bacterium]